jgi:hypothetical protein
MTPSGGGGGTAAVAGTAGSASPSSDGISIRGRAAATGGSTTGGSSNLGTLRVAPVTSATSGSG